MAVGGRQLAFTAIIGGEALLSTNVTWEVRGIGS